MISRCLLAFTVTALAVMAEDPPAAKLGPVIWNPWTHTLKWTAEDGRFNDKGEWKKSGQTEYSIDFHKGIMFKNGKKPLPFTASEAARMDGLFNKLASEYAVESIQWYEGGGKMQQRQVERPADPTASRL